MKCEIKKKETVLKNETNNRESLQSEEKGSRVKERQMAKDREDYCQTGLNPSIPFCRFTTGKAGLLQASVLLALPSK